MLNRLDTPTKRVGFLATLVGLVLIAMAFTAFLDTSTPLAYFIERFLEGPFRAYRSWGREVRGWAAFQTWVGFLLVVGGGLCAFAYEQTVGRLIRWIRTGK